MKQLLVLTDFSRAAIHAAQYAYSLAKQIQANVILFNAVIIPAEVPQMGLIVWPLEGSEALVEESEAELEKLKLQLQINDGKTLPHPAISMISKHGTLHHAVKEILEETSIDYMVIATHRPGWSGLMLGDHTRTLIDEVGGPLFIVSPLVKIAPIRKIAFATDFENPDNDLQTITKVIALAGLLSAGVYITHVYRESEASPDFYQAVQKIMLDISCVNDYPKIHYKAIKNTDIKEGLRGLASSDMDLLVLVHHSHSFLHRLIIGSLTQKLAGEVAIPLLVFREAPAPPLI